MLIRRYNLPSNLVKSFLTVIRMRSHTKAAQSLSLTQPAVSQHISRLEDLLGVILIERSRGAVIPTKEGLELIPDFERLERSVDMIFDKARTLTHEGHSSIRIATPTSLVHFLLAPGLKKMIEEGSNIFPVIREVDDYSVYDMVRAGEVEFALTSMTGSDAELSDTTLLKDRACVVFPPGHELDTSGDVSIEELLPYKFIRPPQGTAANNLIEQCQTKKGIQFEFVGETSRLMTMDVMVHAGIGVVILPALSAHLIAQNNLKYRLINNDTAFRTCRIIKAHGKKLSQCTQKLVNTIEGNAKHLTTELPHLFKF